MAGGRFFFGASARPSDGMTETNADNLALGHGAESGGEQRPTRFKNFCAPEITVLVVGFDDNNVAYVLDKFGWRSRCFGCLDVNSITSTVDPRCPPVVEYRTSIFLSVCTTPT